MVMAFDNSSVLEEAVRDAALLELLVLASLADAARTPFRLEDVAGQIVQDKHRVAWPRLVPVTPYRFDNMLQYLVEQGFLDRIIPRWEEIVHATRRIMWRHSIQLHKIMYGTQVIQRSEENMVFRVVAVGWGVDVADWKPALLELVSMLEELGLVQDASGLHVEIVHRHAPYMPYGPLE